MKKKRFLTVAVLVTLVLSLTGCGTPLHEMTEEEEALIVKYSAYAVAKFNVYQKDGMTAARPDPRAVKDDSLEEESEESTETKDSGVTSGEEVVNIDETDVVSSSTIALADALGLGEGVSVQYNGYDVVPAYEEGGYYALDAGYGHSYVVMNFTISNKSAEAVSVNLLSPNNKFSIQLNGEDRVSAESTFLTYSLTTYEGILESGESVDVVLLFKTSDLTDTANLETKMYAEKNGTLYLVNL